MNPDGIKVLRMKEFSLPQIYGVIGLPLGHSMSPRLHTTAFQVLGLPAVLAPWPLEPAQLPAFMEAFRLLNIQGACVTIPHKRAIIALADQATDLVRTVGAANLLYWRDGLIWADNTDVPGFLAPLRQAAGPFNPVTSTSLAEPLSANSRALVLGAGGAARAVAAGLKMLGLNKITVTDIAPEAAETLASDFDLQMQPWDRRGQVEAELIVNVTPLGMLGHLEAQTPFPAEWLVGRKPGLAYDIVYSPFETKFLKEAGAAGWLAVNGLPMFLEQADHQFQAWTGRHLPDEAKQVVWNELAGC